MKSFEMKGTGIDGCYLISFRFVEDSRGTFSKAFEKNTFYKMGLDFSCDEVFYSRSFRNVIRGMHFQLNNPQAKIVSTTSGIIYDVVVDLRKGSQTYGKWIGHELSLEKHLAMMVPRGCAHGFMTISNYADVLYICDGIYDAESDTGIRYDDADIGIKWPSNDLTEIVLSNRDASLMSFREFEKTKMFKYM